MVAVAGGIWPGPRTNLVLSLGAPSHQSRPAGSDLIRLVRAQRTRVLPDGARNWHESPPLMQEAETGNNPPGSLSFIHPYLLASPLRGLLLACVRCCCNWSCAISPRLLPFPAFRFPSANRYRPHNQRKLNCRPSWLAGPAHRLILRLCFRALARRRLFRHRSAETPKPPHPGRAALFAPPQHGYYHGGRPRPSSDRRANHRALELLGRWTPAAGRSGSVRSLESRRRRPMNSSCPLGERRPTRIARTPPGRPVSQPVRDRALRLLHRMRPGRNAAAHP